ncbi:PH domain-containing protein [Fontisphaera persica]|uniref:PH domain-containing protein n=1 Tax=Fontisphaera persica TaxID=2974023 RepID=UPI0024C0A9D3|nr:PH domain-containing protein [Fontisphaera persica]WCJ60530.1 PH domain-containing protein [Fontisphaera persica]
MLPPALPPVIPPPPPPTGTVPGDGSLAALVEGRLHPFTLLLTIGQAIRNFFIPLVIVLFLGRRTEGTFLFWIALMVGLSLTYSLIRYFTFSYRITSHELITTQGLLGRLERKIPLSRVQDVRIEQSLVQRLLGVVELQIETAGGQGAEANLSVLALGEAEKLRALILTHAGRAVPAPAAAESPSQAVMPSEEILRRLTLGDLVRAGLTSNYIASALVVLLVVWQQLDDLLPESVYQQLGRFLEQSVNQAATTGQGFSWTAALILALTLLSVGLVFSVAGSIMLFYGFTLSRCGEDLRRTYGLFTRRSSSLPRRRIQVLRIDEPWLRRCLGLATLRADTAGSAPGEEEEEKSGHDVLLPVTRRNELEPLLPAILPVLVGEPQTPWRRVSPRAIRRGTLKGAWMVLLLTTAACLVWQSWAGLWLLGFLPVVYGLNVQAYRHLGYRLGEFFFWSRQGWLSRKTWIVPLRNAQTVILHQNPLDRWHGVASIRVDTAGQTSTGGGPHLHNVPADEALELARALAQKASALRYRW